jgi:hypothetical protein
MLRHPTRVELAIWLAALSMTGCASARPQSPGSGADDLRDPHAPGHSSVTGGVAGGASGAGPSPTGTRECRGPGTYGYGKGAPRIECCEGLATYYLGVPVHDEHDFRVCEEPIDGLYGCVRGECGDGECEVGEDAACGCSEDCPGAAWEGTDLEEVPLSTDNGFTALPATCEKKDLLASLQTSENAVSCGDLSYRATDAEKAEAVACVRDAFDSRKPFQVFWVSPTLDGNDTPFGFVARLEDDGLLHVFSLTAWLGTDVGVDFNYFGVLATWSSGSLEIVPSCSTTPNECFGFSPGLTWCECRSPDRRPPPGAARAVFQCLQRHPD